MNLKRNSQSGFTMIEIMVVVVIVAILAVIALPTYLDYVKKFICIRGKNCYVKYK